MLRATTTATRLAALAVTAATLLTAPTASATNVNCHGHGATPIATDKGPPKDKSGSFLLTAPKSLRSRSGAPVTRRAETKWRSRAAA